MVVVTGGTGAAGRPAVAVGRRSAVENGARVGVTIRPPKIIGTSVRVAVATCVRAGAYAAVLVTGVFAPGVFVADDRPDGRAVGEADGRTGGVLAAPVAAGDFAGAVAAALTAAGVSVVGTVGVTEGDGSAVASGAMTTTPACSGVPFSKMPTP